MRTRKGISEYVCQSCGYRTGKWLGRCPSCLEWQCLVEERPTEAAGAGRRSGRPAAPPLPLLAVDEPGQERLTSNILELDRVLGGGIVPGSMVLIGGDPGIGKSTLLLQMLARIASQGHRVLYVSGEESTRQIGLRGKRLGALHRSLLLATEACLETILAMAREIRPALLAIDSIQTLYTEEIASAPGSVAQIRESAAGLMRMAKEENLPVVLAGHVTKDGAIAGPRVLEHMVDTVLYFEGDRGQAYRILRAVKNRFGSTNEIGVFEMKEGGLAEVTNPSEIFLAERPFHVSGSVVLPSVEGTRPILVEVQALVSPSSLGMPRRTAIGADPQRLSLLAAVLEKRAGLSLASHDIYCNLAGGIRIDEPALDLGLVCAIASSLLEKPLPPGTAVCGEIGLAGEVRGICHAEMRIQETSRLGFNRLVLPATSLARLPPMPASTLELSGVSSIESVLRELF